VNTPTTFAAWRREAENDLDGFDFFVSNSILVVAKIPNIPQ
jgi:hypothetical protein